jgi:hypothetical protein
MDIINPKKINGIFISPDGGPAISPLGLLCSTAKVATLLSEIMFLTHIE